MSTLPAHGLPEEGIKDHRFDSEPFLGNADGVAITPHKIAQSFGWRLAMA